MNSLYANVMRKMSSAFIEDKPQGALQLSSLFIFLDSNFKDKQGEAVQKLIGRRPLLLLLVQRICAD